ncbi:MAG: hypothetical protein HRT44_03675 [Bdellovibrionales bacterium]|nr:hypothetical protein [Bdellovibrionales bacterium]NQZ18343.1 hypothetical protein [Bdellovibrionales bacterium]
MTKLLSILSLIITAGAGYYYINKANQPVDLCQAEKLNVQQTVVTSKEKSRLKLFMGSSYDKKVRRFLPYVKQIKTTSYYHRQKLKPKYTTYTTEFRSKKVAKKAYRYLSWKWKKKNKKKGQFDVVIKGKTVTMFSNSHYQPKCFAKVIKSTKKKLGVVEKPKKNRVVKRIKRVKRVKRTLASVKRKSKKRRVRR